MNIAIAGYGVEGKVSYKYFTARGHTVTILDEREIVDHLPAEASVVLGRSAFQNLTVFDMVMRTPSLPPAKLAGAKKIWSATNEFFEKSPAPIIGVTGSKGKGTTTSLIASILRAAGKTVHLVGNIGVPALEVLESVQPNDVVVYELSSFQLWDIERSPHIGVVLMIEPDHLDVHKDFQEYAEAKRNITRYQTANDVLVYNNTNEVSRAIGEASVAVKIPFQSDIYAHVADGYFWYGEQKICSVNALKLPGRHNQDNACAAIDAAWTYVDSSEAIEKGLSAFTGLPHRLKFVREVEGVKYYDDSIATTPGSAIAAIDAFEAPKVLILGGSSKGSQYDDLARAISQQTMRQVILIGDEAPKIKAALSVHETPFVNLGTQVTMKEIVIEAKRYAMSGDVVLLSPACASFGMFKGYDDRGDQFVNEVEAL